jgi:hypothetical protein
MKTLILLMTFTTLASASDLTDDLSFSIDTETEESQRELASEQPESEEKNKEKQEKSSKPDQSNLPYWKY